MTVLSRRPGVVALLLALIVGVAGCGAPASEPAALSGQRLVEALQDGGYVLVLRHTATGSGGIDSLTTLGDCAAQRSLTDAGREDARSLGAAVRELDIAIGRVVASPFCRTVETAELAFGMADTDRALLALASVGEDGSEPQERTLDAARRLAAQVPEPGTNTALVGHVSTIGPLTGSSPGEGGTVVLKPDGEGGFDVVGEIGPGGWQELAAG